MYFHIFIFTFWNNWNSRVLQFFTIYIHAPKQSRKDYSASHVLWYQILTSSDLQDEIFSTWNRSYHHFYQNRKWNIQRKFKLSISKWNVMKSCLKIYTVIIFFVNTPMPKLSAIFNHFCHTAPFFRVVFVNNNCQVNSVKLF